MNKAEGWKVLDKYSVGQTYYSAGFNWLCYYKSGNIFVREEKSSYNNRSWSAYVKGFVYSLNYP